MSLRKTMELASFVVLLGVSLIFGFLGKGTEMGLAVVAGAISLVFLNLEKIASFKGGGIEIITKEEKEQIQAVIEKETEPASFQTDGYGADESARKIIGALKNPKYTWRYVKGLVEESGESEEQVKRTLEWLAANGLGSESNGKKGRIWTLSQKGREVFSHIQSGA